MSYTEIEWADRVWNPTRGCSEISPECARCYAMRQAHRFSGPAKAYEGLTELGPNGPRWTGVVRLVPEMLEVPLHWRKPSRIFVDSMSDLFHEALPDADVVRVLEVVRRGHALGHTFLVLTKRAGRMMSILSRLQFDAGTLDQEGRGLFLEDRGGCVDGSPKSFARVLRQLWVGVSVGNRKHGLPRIEELRQTPAARRFLSIEPLLEDLGPLDLTGIHWVIVGGESGNAARPCQLAWVRAVVAQCQAAGVPCFVKQLGANPTVDLRNQKGHGPPSFPVSYVDSKGGDPAEWPMDLRVRELPEVAHG